MVDDPGRRGGHITEDLTCALPISVSGTKFEDLTGDGKTDDDQPWSHGGVTIFIDDDNSGDLSAGDRQATTDANGDWSIGGLTLARKSVVYGERVHDGSEQTGNLVQ